MGGASEPKRPSPNRSLGVLVLSPHAVRTLGDSGIQPRLRLGRRIASRAPLFSPYWLQAGTACAIAQSSQRGNQLAGAGANLRGHPSEAYKRAVGMELYREA